MRNKPQQETNEEYGGAATADRVDIRQLECTYVEKEVQRKNAIVRESVRVVDSCPLPDRNPPYLNAPFAVAKTHNGYLLPVRAVRQRRAR